MNRVVSARVALLAALLPASAAAGDGRPLFAAAQAQLGGVGAAVVTADFDEDGLADLVSATWTESDVRVVTGNGFGQFSAPAVFPTAGGIANGGGLVAVDLDGDGHEDVLVANNPSGLVSWHRGAGDGSLPLAASFPAGSRPSALALADYDGDGNLDVAVSHYFDPAEPVSILLGDGHGGLSAPHDVGPSLVAHSVAAADVDADGDADLAVTDSYYNHVALLFGDGAAAFPTQTTLTLLGTNKLYAVALHDLDADGRPDLLVGALGTGAVVTLKNLGAGSFGPTHYFFSSGTASPGFLLVADLDLDGHPDVLAADMYGETVEIFRGLGDTTLKAFGTIEAGGSGVAVADFDGDAVPDVAGMSDYDGRSTLFFGRGDVGFQKPALYKGNQFGSTSGTGAVLADLDGDGLLDVVRPYTAYELVGLRHNVGGGLLSELDDVHLGVPPTRTAVGDVNGDGYADLVSASDASDVLSVHFGNAAGGWHSATLVVANGGPQDVVLADVDGDGVLDALTANAQSKTVELFHGARGAVFPVATQTAAGATPARLIVADLDLDGALDALTVNSSDDSVSLLRGTAGGGLLPGLLAATPNDPRRAVAADLDEDGAPDVAVVCRVVFGQSPGTLGLWHVGPSGLVPWATLPVGHSPEDLAADDLDGDSHLDLVVAHDYDPLFLMLGDGHGGFPQLQTSRSMGTAIATGDLDGDGRPDLVTTLETADLNVYLNLHSPWGRLAFGGDPDNPPPELSGLGTLEAGSAGSLRLTGASPSSVGLLLLGLHPIAKPIAGAFLYPAPDVVIPIVTDAGGELLLSWNAWPAGIPAATRLQFQAWLPHAGGYVVSKALKALTP